MSKHFKVKPGKSYSPPAGEYVLAGPRQSRTSGTDIDGEVHQLANSQHSSREKFRDNFDRTFKGKEEEK